MYETTIKMTKSWIYSWVGLLQSVFPAGGDFAYPQWGWGPSPQQTVTAPPSLLFIHACLAHQHEEQTHALTKIKEIFCYCLLLNFHAGERHSALLIYQLMHWEHSLLAAHRNQNYGFLIIVVSCTLSGLVAILWWWVNTHKYVFLTKLHTSTYCTASVLPTRTS